MIGLYHNADLDGLACAVLIQKHYPEATLYGYNYNEPLPDFTSPYYLSEDLIIADLNFPHSTLEKLAKCFKSVYYIDHHQQAAPNIKNLAFHIDTDKAACELMYDFVWGITYSNKTYPYWIRQIARWDIHRDKDGIGWEECKNYQFGLKHVNTPQELLKALKWPKWYIIWKGSIILQYKDAISKKRGLTYGYFTIEPNLSVKVSISNAPMDTKDIPNEGQHMHLVLSLDVKTLKVQITFVNLPFGMISDVSEIARTFGGGGHKAIAGCYIENIKNYLTLI